MAGLLGLLSEAFMNSPETYAALPDLGVKFFDTPGSKVNGYVPPEAQGLLSKFAFMGAGQGAEEKYNQQSQLAKLAPLAAAGDKSALIQLATIEPQVASALASTGKGTEKVQEIGGKLVAFDPANPNAGARVIYGDDGKKPVNADVIKGEGELRKEFEGLQKDFRQVQGGYERLQAAAKNPSAAGDLALIFNYMKILDPGSTVREGEFANAQNAAGIPDIVRNMYNRAKSGERLNPDQRNDFVNQAQGIYGAQLELFNQGAAKYRGLAEQYGFDPERVTKAIDAPKKTGDSPAPSKYPEGTVIKNAAGARMVRRNGKWEPM